MDQEAGRSSADKRVVKDGDEDPWLLAPGRTRAQRREAQLRSQSTAKSEDFLTDKYREELTVRDIRRILKKEKIAFDSRAKKKDLLDVLEQHKPKEGLKETLRQPSEHSPRGSTHAPDHPHDYVTKSEDQVQNLTSQTQSTPQATSSTRLDYIRNAGHRVNSKKMRLDAE
ncbi:hypothetical protein F5883DRAFT_530159 [Diaporthe sp. PMI_573]|nr:hypothetical protein F5883DRAFT_530159 [Diaporthaceae sp. PMI_573]